MAKSATFGDTLRPFHAAFLGQRFVAFIPTGYKNAV
jgi:hypothetical protein